MTTQAGEFINRLRTMLHDSYTLEKNGKSVTAEQKGEIKGFMKAGKMLGIVTFDELQIIVTEESKKVFGATFSERTKQESASSKENNSSEEKFSMIPAFMRLRNRGKK
ncbi:MAG: hypothetical protein HQM09_24640 [Candidatus Riflebacteria bacterium]|nr:hypothetical protein [Candidatus Riflebacteria bacterium]